jgi:ubiquitin-conjugating enzyme E2 O
MLEPLSEGEVVVAFDFFGNERGKFKEDDVEVVDRSLRLGEAVKEVGDGVRCGVVIGYDVQMRLGHAISGQKLPGWVGGKDVKWNNRLGVGSYVVHGNWVGQVSSGLC